METIAYKVGSVWSEVGFDALGVGSSFQLDLQTHAASKCTLPLAARAPENAPIIPFEAQCIIYTGRSPFGAGFNGGSILFQGRRTDNMGQVSGSDVSQTLVIEDAWYDLRFLTLQAVWQIITGGVVGAPTYGTATWPDCILFQNSPGGMLQPNGSFIAYAPPPVYNHITTGQAIKEILAYAISVAGVNLQIGQIDPAAYVPWYPVRSVRCADAIKHALRVHPDCTCEIDYTSTPPTFNVRQQVNLTPMVLPYKSQSGSKAHLTSKVKPRPDLQVPRVGIYLKETITVNGQAAVSVGTDIYPAALPSTLRSLDASLDLSGPKFSVTTQPVTSAPFNPTDLTWWATKVPALRPQAQGGEIPNAGNPGALAILDPFINYGHPLGIQVVDANNNPINLISFPNELTSGAICSWMTLANGTPVNLVEATVIAFFSYNKQTSVNGKAVTDVAQQHSHSVRIKLTNSPTASYSLSQETNFGEGYPGGLAQSIFTALQPLQYEFEHEIMERPFATMIKPGKHALNLTGGAVAWQTMAAMIQSVQIELMLSPASGTVTAKTKVKCGPVEHLEAGQLVQLFNIFANRDVNKINANERLTGQPGGVTNGMPTDTPRENTTPANPVMAVQNFGSPNGAGATLTHIDTTQGQIALM